MENLGTVKTYQTHHSFLIKRFGLFKTHFVVCLCFFFWVEVNVVYNNFVVLHLVGKMKLY